MSCLIKLLGKNYRRSGLLGGSRSILMLVIRKCVPFQIRSNFRRSIGSRLHVQFSGQVLYGPCKGRCVPKDLVWPKNDLASILIGSYEREVTELQNVHYIFEHLKDSKLVWQKSVKCHLTTLSIQKFSFFVLRGQN